MRCHYFSPHVGGTETVVLNEARPLSLRCLRGSLVRDVLRHGSEVVHVDLGPVEQFPNREHLEPVAPRLAEYGLALLGD